MMPRQRLPFVLLVLCVLVVTVGCPSSGFFGRYIVINSSKDAIQNITLAARGQEKTWPITESGGGWISDSFGSNCTSVDVTWMNAAGESKHRTIDFSSRVGGHCKDDLIIEFTVQGVPVWRMAPAPSH
ncbi:hypothetical protein NA78x_004766 [Anatilimnocola sp. NA78]|uniref:hypothetical protein n=1 Tax=Anatilimnocola sp. NA78 TaxID=3415683 RepID=UPI003CE50737